MCEICRSFADMSWWCSTSDMFQVLAVPKVLSARCEHCMIPVVSWNGSPQIIHVHRMCMDFPLNVGTSTMYNNHKPPIWQWLTSHLWWWLGVYHCYTMLYPLINTNHRPSMGEPPWLSGGACICWCPWSAHGSCLVSAVPAEGPSRPGEETRHTETVNRHGLTAWPSGSVSPIEHCVKKNRAYCK